MLVGLGLGVPFGLFIGVDLLELGREELGLLLWGVQKSNEIVSLCCEAGMIIRDITDGVTLCLATMLGA